MSWIIAAVAIYCIFAAALIVILSVFSSRLSRQENVGEVWDTELGRDAGDAKAEPKYSHLSSNA